MEVNPNTEARPVPGKSHDILQARLDQIRQLLKKHRVVEQIVHKQESHRHELLESLAHRQNLGELHTRLARLHPADIVYILGALSTADRQVVWEQVGDSLAGEVLLEASPELRRQLIEHTPEHALRAMLRPMDADDLSYLADDLPEEILQERLRAFSDEDRTWVEASIQYPAESVGAMMSPLMITVRDDDTLAQVQNSLRRLDELPIHTDKVFVLDRRGIFRGALPITSLLLGRPEARVGEVMAGEVVQFRADDSASEAAHAFERYDLVSAPVVNERGKLVGRLTVDVMLDYHRQRRADQLLRLAGLGRSEDLFLTIWRSARNRWVWLSLNLVTALIASRVIGSFEHSITQLVALAALMPIVASVGGNTGNQTNAIVLRAITMGQLNAGNVFQLVRREIGIGALNGLLLGLVVALFALVFYQNLALGGVIASAMLLNLLVAALLGLAVPLLLHRLGKDPALGSSVLITAATDSIGFYIFLGMATVLLL